MADSEGGAILAPFSQKICLVNQFFSASESASEKSSGGLLMGSCWFFLS
jgi:hypothetical protein